MGNLNKDHRYLFIEVHETQRFYVVELNQVPESNADNCDTPVPE